MPSLGRKTLRAARLDSSAATGARRIVFEDETGAEWHVFPAELLEILATAKITAEFKTINRGGVLGLKLDKGN